MDERAGDTTRSELFQHPLIRQIGRLFAEVAETRLMIVHPTPSGWGQVYADDRPDLMPAYCQLFHGTPEGAKQCRMSHILMAVAASSGGPKVQRCHTGASVMVCPVAEPNAEATAILSTCIFASPAAWAEASRRGKTFGLDQGALRKAFQALPHISDSRRRLIETAMKAMSLAVLEINRRIATEARLQSLEQANASRVDLSQLLHKTDWALAGETPAPDATEDGRAPLLVRVVCELVRQRPEMPLTIKELAAAARVTPNHLTTIFAQRTGQSFTRFLAEQRLLRAKELLGDLTLHVNEIARRVGYDDPGYFARRFRQLTGLSPREWRQRRPGGDSANSGR